MNLNAVGIVYRKEFTEWVRDRRTLISSQPVPVLIFPIMIVGIVGVSSAMVGKAKQETPKVMIIGGENSPKLLASLSKSDKIEIVPYAANWKDQISNRNIRAAAEIPKGFETSLESGSPQTVKIYYYEGEIKSSFGVERVEKF